MCSKGQILTRLCKILNSAHPTCLCDHLSRSAGPCFLCKHRAFELTVPSAWNALPPDIFCFPHSIWTLLKCRLHRKAFPDHHVYVKQPLLHSLFLYPAFFSFLVRITHLTLRICGLSVHPVSPPTCQFYKGRGLACFAYCGTCQCLEQCLTKSSCAINAGQWTKRSPDTICNILCLCSFPSGGDHAFQYLSNGVWAPKA